VRTKNVMISLFAAALLIAGCAGQKGPATQAVTAAETALAAIKDDAAKYLPSDLQGVEATLTSLKDGLAKGDYKAVLAGAPALMTSLTSLKDAAAAKKTEMVAATAAATTEWGALSADLPNMVAAIKSRVDVLSGSKRLPKNITQSSFDSAKAGLDMINNTWTEATAAFGAGNAVDAVAKAKMVKEKGAEVLKLLGMSAG
jgi:hypothetical protein